jgi:hypothetical protein
MIIIQGITSVGTEIRYEMQQVEFVVKCHYAKCEVEFTTIDPDRLYCKNSHGVRAREFRAILRPSTPSRTAQRS